MSTQTLAPQQIKKRGMEALTRDLGTAGMVQFMQQFSSGAGNYSKERHKLLGELSVDEVWADMENASKTRKYRRIK
jgi:hypothetical protein